MFDRLSDFAADVATSVSRRQFIQRAGQAALALFAVLNLGMTADARPRGCRTNDDCGEGFFCARRGCRGPGQCVQRPDFCAEIYDPVCGCDGVTYSSACHAAMAGVSVQHPGECRVRPRR